jgi:hypothetical protein
MPSTYTTSGIELIGDGEQSGTWGSTTNENLQILSRMISEAGTITLSGTTHTLPVTDGALSEGQYAVLVFGGSPSGTNTVTITPNDAKRTYFVKNDSGESVILTQGSGGNVTVADGDVAIVYCDGAGTGAAVVDISGLTSNDIGVTVQAYSSVLQNTTASFTTADETKLDGIDQGVATTDSPSFAGLTVDTNTLYVDSSNNRIGINTTSPSEKLSVTGNIGLNGALSFSGNYREIGQSSSTSLGVGIKGGTSNTDGASIALYGKDHATNAGNMYLTTGGATGTGGTVFRRRLDASFSESMRIDSSGNVGIGTSGPTNALDVRASGSGIARLTSTGATSAVLYFSDTNSTGVFAQSIGSVGDDIRINTSNSEAMRIDSSGNVGVGTNSPSEKLSVTGNISVTGTVDGRDVAADGIKLDDLWSFGFESRSALVSYWGGLSISEKSAVSDGAVWTDGTVAYVRDSGATAISDLAGWVPYGDVTPDHFGENTTPGTTDMRAAIQAAWDWSISVGKQVVGLSATYVVSGSGLSQSGREYGLLIKDGLKFHAMAGCTLKVMSGEDIDLVQTDLTMAPLARVVFSGELTIDGNQANVGPNNGFGIWFQHITHLSNDIIRVRNTASFGVRIETCDRHDFTLIEAEQEPNTNADGVHWIDTLNVTGRVMSESLGDDAVAVSARNRDVENYNLTVIAKSPYDASVVAGRRGFLINLTDDAVVQRTMRNIYANVVAEDCDGPAVSLFGAIFEGITVDVVARNCQNALYLVPGTAALPGGVTNCVFRVNGHDMNEQCVIVVDDYASVGISDNHLEFTGSNPGDGFVGVSLTGAGWSGYIDLNYDPDSSKASPSFGVDLFADTSNLTIGCRNADTNLNLRATATDNTINLMELSGGITRDLDVNASATGLRLIGGKLSTSRILPSDTEIVSVDGLSSKIDGRNVAADGAKLDAIDQGVATTDSPTFAGLTVDTNTLYVDSANNRVGIGTSSPGASLDVVGSLRGGSNTVSGNYNLSLRSGASDATFLTRYSTGVAEIRNYGGAFQLATQALEDILILTNNTERLRIDSSGNVGIGTSNPGSKLSIVGLPTSSAGLSAGDVWNDGGTLKIV